MTDQHTEPEIDCAACAGTCNYGPGCSKEINGWYQLYLSEKEQA